MYGWGASLATPPLGFEPDRERRPPATPTLLDFPVYSPSYSDRTSHTPLSDLYDILCSIKRPQDISHSRFQALNLNIVSNLPASDLISRDSLLPLPSLPWEETYTEDGPPILLSNDNPYPTKDRYDLIQKELLIDNDDAFREAARLPPRQGRERVRITQTRKFWAGLEKMAQYWDASLDRYYDRPITVTRQGDPDDKGESYTLSEISAPEPMDIDNQTAQDAQSGNAATVSVYTGRRTGAGHEMPEDIREETIRAFTEMAAWPFGCQIFVPTVPPRLSVRTLLFPVRLSFAATRLPKDRQLARKGIMEGPLFVGQCRPETMFRDDGEAHGAGVGEVCDLYREVGAMLLAAQERIRDGLTETKPGEGKWWTTKPRWGGAPDPVTEGDANSADKQPSSATRKEETTSSRKRSKYGRSPGGLRLAGSERRLSNSERWKLIQPGPSLWDKRMTYKQIGKNQDSPFDDIYMVSSINHHVAILHLRVHRRYMEILTAGASASSADVDTTGSAGQKWDELKLRRSRWYNLLDGPERLEAFQGVWSIFHYLMR